MGTLLGVYASKMFVLTADLDFREGMLFINTKVPHTRYHVEISPPVYFFQVSKIWDHLPIPSILPPFEAAEEKWTRQIKLLLLISIPLDFKEPRSPHLIVDAI